MKTNKSKNKKLEEIESEGKINQSICIIQMYICYQYLIQSINCTLKWEYIYILSICSSHSTQNIHKEINTGMKNSAFGFLQIKSNSSITGRIYWGFFLQLNINIWISLKKTDWVICEKKTKVIIDNKVQENKDKIGMSNLQISQIIITMTKICE